MKMSIPAVVTASQEETAGTSVVAEAAADSPLQKEYKAFLKARVKEWGKKSPFEGTEEDIVEFFSGVRREWRKYKKDNDLVSKADEAKAVAVATNKDMLLLSRTQLTAEQELFIRNTIRSINADTVKVRKQLTTMLGRMEKMNFPDVPLVETLNNKFSELIQFGKLVVGVR